MPANFLFPFYGSSFSFGIEVLPDVIVNFNQIHFNVSLCRLTWNNPFEIAVSRMNRPKLDYILSAGDVGYFIKVEVSPIHIRCNPGEIVTAITNQPEVVQIVDLETEIIPSKYGGIGFQYTGTVGSGATLIKDLKIEWI